MPAAPPPDLATEPLASHHDRAAFTCGVESLDNYFRMYAGQDVKRRANGVFVLVRQHERSGVLGYYTLCATSLAHGDVPETARKHLPRYPVVAATLLGRLAVAAGRQGQGLGALLIADAMRRTYASAAAVGSSMLVVDAIGDEAAAFYRASGFVSLPDSSRLVLPMSVIAKLVEH